MGSWGKRGTAKNEYVKRKLSSPPHFNGGLSFV